MSHEQHSRKRPVRGLCPGLGHRRDHLQAAGRASAALATGAAQVPIVLAWWPAHRPAAPPAATALGLPPLPALQMDRRSLILPCQRRRYATDTVPARSISSAPAAWAWSACLQPVRDPAFFHLPVRTLSSLWRVSLVRPACCWSTARWRRRVTGWAADRYGSCPGQLKAMPATLAPASQAAGIAARPRQAGGDRPRSFGLAGLALAWWH